MGPSLLYPYFLVAPQCFASSPWPHPLFHLCPLSPDCGGLFMSVAVLSPSFFIYFQRQTQHLSCVCSLVLHSASFPAKLLGGRGRCVAELRGARVKGTQARAERGERRKMFAAFENICDWSVVSGIGGRRDVFLFIHVRRLPQASIRPCQQHDIRPHPARECFTCGSCQMNGGNDAFLLCSILFREPPGDFNNAAGCYLLCAALNTVQDLTKLKYHVYLCGHRRVGAQLIRL